MAVINVDYTLVDNALLQLEIEVVETEAVLLLVPDRVRPSIYRDLSVFHI